MHATCIRCWAEDSLVKLHLDGSETFECEPCGETFTCEDVRGTMQAMKEWERVLKWVESAPVDEEEVAAN